ncbi:hypothetical protein G7Y89_g11730 [Cudoniella acicularis]|uniref:Uncharacterized protein n=1 Tax=Cudoniella acicularis TaxID=354080 RepID=A0A8H4W0D1_9HELO|nr:hypothetical protein G7Y89_g11730 [Cudoniella acicularis]
MQFKVYIVAALASAVAGRHVFAVPEELMNDIAISEFEMEMEQQNDVGVYQTCYWEGSAPFCKGKCKNGFVETARTKCGDGKCCATGSKALCCK